MSVNSLIIIRQVRIPSQGDPFYLQYRSSYILSSVLEIFAVNREDLVTSNKTTVSLCDASFDLSIRVTVNQWDFRNVFGDLEIEIMATAVYHFFPLRGVFFHARVNFCRQDKAAESCLFRSDGFYGRVLLAVGKPEAE